MNKNNFSFAEIQAKNYQQVDVLKLRFYLIGSSEYDIKLYPVVRLHFWSCSFITIILRSTLAWSDSTCL